MTQTISKNETNLLFAVAGSVAALATLRLSTRPELWLELLLAVSLLGYLSLTESQSRVRLTLCTALGFACTLITISAVS